MLEKTDPFGIRRLTDYGNFVAREVGDLRHDLEFLKTTARVLLPTRLDWRSPLDPNIFPPFRREPHPHLAGKRVALVASGGSGALVALCGIKRALEEAEIEVAALSVCSGSAIWGSLIAAGYNAQQMVDECFRWTPKDIVDLDWRNILAFPWVLGRGFAGLVQGRAFESTLERALGGVTLGQATLPYYSVVLNVDTNKLGYFGPHNHPDVPLATMVRVAIALPLFVHPVQLGEHYYIDGGVVNVFPVEPLLQQEEPFDYFIGVNTILPPGFDGGEDISGWLERPMSILEVSRQLWHAQHIELARQQLDRVRDRTLLIEPLHYSEITGAKFYEVLLDNQRWPDFILRGYHTTKEQLRRFPPAPASTT